jgi:hypothetical protein
MAVAGAGDGGSRNSQKSEINVELPTASLPSFKGIWSLEA